MPSTPSAPSSSSSSSSSSPAVSSSLFLATPPAVLSVICQHLTVHDLLRLFRSCSELHRLNASDTTFSSAAWSRASLRLTLDQRLHYWTLPYKACVWDEHSEKLHLPLSLWQQALPVIRYTVEQWLRSDETYLSTDERDALRALLAEQPTSTVRVGGQDHVVLSALTFTKLSTEIVAQRRFPCYRSRFVLAAMPQLQHMKLVIDKCIVLLPSASDMFALVPRLHSLHLVQDDSDEGDFVADVVRVHDMLASLPRLTSLTCRKVELGVQDLIDIAAHCTLEELRLSSKRAAYHDRAWLADGIEFDGGDIDEEEVGCDGSQRATGEMEEAQRKDAAAADDDCAGLNEYEKEDRRAQNRWLPLALARVIPSQRSIRVRLALANTLHRQLSRQLIAAGSKRPLSLLHHYRRQVVVLRLTLRNQLAASSAAMEGADESAARRGTKRSRSNAVDT